MLGYVAHVSPASAHDADEAPRCGTHFQHYLGLCWAMLILHRKIRKIRQAKNTVKRGSFGRSAHGRRRGRDFLSPTERRDGLRQGHGLGASRAPGRIIPYIYMHVTNTHIGVGLGLNVIRIWHNI